MAGSGICPNATEVVDRQISAFRDRDLERFLGCHAAGVKVRDFGSNVLMDGPGYTGARIRPIALPSLGSPDNSDGRERRAEGRSAAASKG